MAILTQFCQVKARLSAARNLRKAIQRRCKRRALRRIAQGVGVDIPNRRGGRLIAPPDRFQSRTDFAHRGARSGRFDAQLEQIAAAVTRRRLNCCQGCSAALRVTRLAQCVEPSDLRCPHRLVVDLQDIGRRTFGRGKAVDADDHRLACINSCLASSSAGLNLCHRPALLDRAGHATECIHLLN